MSISPHHQSHPQHQQHQQELMLEPDSATTEQTDEDMNKYEDVGGTVIAFNGKRRDGEHGTGATLVELKKMRGADGKMKIAIGETDQAALQKQKEMQRTPRSPRIQPIMTGRDDDEPDYAHLIQELESRERAAEQRIQMQQRKMDARAQELAALEQRLQEEDQNLQRFQQSLQQQQRQFQQQQKQFQKEQLQQHQQHQQQQHTLTSDEYRELLELRQQRHAYQNANHANTPSSISRDRYERLARENQKLTLDLKQVNRQVDNAIRHAQLQLNSPRVSTSPTKTPRLQLPTVRSGASPMSARSMGPSPRSGPSPRGVAAPSPRIAGLQGERGLTARGGGDGEGAVYTREDMATKNAEISTLNRHMEWANRELQQLREKVASQPVQRIIELENTLVERDRTIKALQKDIRMMNRVIDDHNKKAFHDEFIGAPVARIEAESKHLKERLKIAEHKVSEQERIIWNQNRLIGEFHIKDVPVSPQ
jgi:chromosome segregation ATPase